MGSMTAHRRPGRLALAGGLALSLDRLAQPDVHNQVKFQAAIMARLM
jgi:hypothetical protein